jgi:uncharacterized protein YciI
MRKLSLLVACLSGAALAQPVATGQFLLRLEPTRPGFTLQNMNAEEASLASQHSRYLMSLLDSGKLSLAAQVFDPKGLWGMVIVNAPDLETARALLEGDPSVKGKMFRGEAIPLRVVLEKPAVRDSAPPFVADPKTLESYTGTYKSDQLPIDIKAFVKDGKLYMQGAGQPEFALKPKSATQFEFPAAQLQIDFDSPASFTLKQAGKGAQFKRVMP